MIKTPGIVEYRVCNLFDETHASFMRVVRFICLTGESSCTFA
jgi:hypothetical protein